MKSSVRVLALALAAPFAVAVAQDTSEVPKDTTAAKPAAAVWSLVPQQVIQYARPGDQRGLNIFESPKQEGVPFTGFKLGWGAAFRQQFQGLEHKNVSNGAVGNQLVDIGRGFNLADANLYLNMQVADGIRVALASYMSSKHHQEFWVKDGYALIDKSPIDHPLLNTIMKYTTLKLGHFETNYGDQHFRRSDNGNAMFNPFVGNLLMDAFTTEIGGELYLRNGPWMIMGGLTGGETRGQVTAPEKRSVAYLGKVGFDKQITPAVRFRLTGSAFSQARSANQSLFTGDRGGSRYYQVMVNTSGTEKDSAWTGNVQPGFKSEQHAYVINPFLKVKGLELRGNLERALGRAATEAENRTWDQYAAEGLYRLLNDKLYFGGRYNTVNGKLASQPNDVTVNRYQIAGGWFVTPTVLLKGEWMDQRYSDFIPTDIRNGGRIKGFMVEGVVAF